MRESGRSRGLVGYPYILPWTGPSSIFLSPRGDIRPSACSATQASLVKIGKKLKKNNVAVDILCFGDLDEENMAKIEAFIGAVNSNDNSHLVTVPTGAALVDCMLSYAPRTACPPRQPPRHAAVGCATL